MHLWTAFIYRLVLVTWIVSIGLTSSASAADPATPLIYLHARYLDPQLGRFVSPDPTIPSQNSIGLNRYEYAGNDPGSTTDSSGLGSNLPEDDVLAARQAAAQDAVNAARGRLASLNSLSNNFGADRVEALNQARIELAGARTAEALASGRYVVDNMSPLFFHSTATAEGPSPFFTNGLDPSLPHEYGSDGPVYMSSEPSYAAGYATGEGEQYVYIILPSGKELAYKGCLDRGCSMESISFRVEGQNFLGRIHIHTDKVGEIELNPASPNANILKDPRLSKFITEALIKGEPINQSKLDTESYWGKIYRGQEELPSWSMAAQRETVRNAVAEQLHPSGSVLPAERYYPYEMPASGLSPTVDGGAFFGLPIRIGPLMK